VTRLRGWEICLFSKPSGSGTHTTSSSVSSKWPTWRTIPLFYNKFIWVLYKFPSKSCSLSRGQTLLKQHLVKSFSVSGRPLCRSSGKCFICIPDGHLQKLTIPDAVLIQSDLLMIARRSSIHVEDCNNLIIKYRNWASSCSFARN